MMNDFTDPVWNMTAIYHVNSVNLILKRVPIRK